MIRRTIRLALHFAASLLVGLVLLVLLVVWRLGQGPIDANFLRAPVERALNPEGAQFGVTVDSVGLTWRGGDAQALVLARGVRLHDRRGTELAVVPDLGVQLAVADLLQGNARLQSVVLLSPTVVLDRAEDGSLDLSFAAQDDGEPAPPPAPGADGPPPPDAMDLLLAAPTSDSVIGALREVAVRDAQLVVRDALLQRQWTVPDMDLSVTRDEAGATVAGTVDLPDGNGHASLRFGYGFADKAGLVEIAFADIRPALLPLEGTFLSGARNIDMPLSGRLDAELSKHEGVRSAVLEVAGQRGAIHLEREPIALHDRPWPVDSFYARLLAHPGAQSLAIERVRLDLGGPLLEARGAVYPTAPGADGSAAQRAQLDVVLTDVPGARLAELWPTQAGPKPRTWIVQNIRGGHADVAAVRVDLRRDASGIHLPFVDGTIHWQDAEVTYLEGLPPLQGVSAEARLGPKAINVVIEGGTQAGLTLGEIRNTGSTAVITGLDAERQYIDLDVGVAGGIPAVLELLDMPRLGYPARLGIKPGDVQGAVEGRLKLYFPLLRALKLEDVQLGAKAVATQVETAPLVAGRRVSGGPLNIALDMDKLTIDGDAALAGIEGKVAWTEVFAPAPGAERTRIAFAGDVSAADLAGLGVDAGPYLTGSAQAALLYRQTDAARSVAVEADLTRAGIEAAEFGLAKPQGRPAKVTLRLPLEADGSLRRIEDIVLEGRDVALRGRVALSADGGLESARIDRLKLGRNDARVAVEPLPRGGRRVTVTGKSIDISTLLERTGRDSDRPSNPADPAAGPLAAEGPPLELALDVGTLWTGADRSLGPVRATAQNDGVEWLQASADAGLVNGGTLSLRLEPRGAVQALSLVASDVGAALRALGIWDALGGGSLNLVAERPLRQQAAPFRGRFAMENYRLLDAPLLATILNAATQEPVDRWQENGAFAFNRVEGQLAYDGRLLRLQDTRHAGGTLGLTTEGELDIAANRIAMQGTIVPLYGLNGLLGDFPLLGELLVGGEGQGVFAATYALDGALDDPRITVNPLAILAPGFLRNLFFLESDPPSLPPAPAAPKIGTGPAEAPPQVLIPKRGRASRAP